MLFTKHVPNIQHLEGLNDFWSLLLIPVFIFLKQEVPFWNKGCVVLSILKSNVSGEIWMKAPWTWPHHPHPMELSEVQSLPRRRSEQMPNFPSLAHSLYSKHSPFVDLALFLSPEKNNQRLKRCFICYTACDVNIHCKQYILYINRCTVVIWFKGVPILKRNFIFAQSPFSKSSWNNRNRIDLRNLGFPSAKVVLAVFQQNLVKRGLDFQIIWIFRYPPVN